MENLKGRKQLGARDLAADNIDLDLKYSAKMWAEVNCFRITSGCVLLGMR